MRRTFAAPSQDQEQDRSKVVQGCLYGILFTVCIHTVVQQQFFSKMLSLTFSLAGLQAA